MTAKELEEVNSDVFIEFNKFGKFQYIQYVLICLPLVMMSMANVNYIFVAQDVDHRCLVPKCEDLNPKLEIPDWWPRNVDAECFQPVIDNEKYLKNETCSNETFYEELVPCHEWVYEHNDSVVSALNLGCQDMKISLIGAIHNAGMIVSMVMTGLASDKLGRKPTFIICSIGGAIGVIKIFVLDYYLYLTIEFLESVLCSGLFTIVVVLLIEIGGADKRVLAGVIFAMTAHSGEMIFGLLAMGLKYYRYLVLVVYLPMLLFIFYFYILKESTRWQLLQGKTIEAKETFKLIAKMNNLKVTENQIAEISDSELRLKLNVFEPKEKDSFKDIVTSKVIMIRLAVMSFGFFSSAFMYYGLAINSVLLPGNKYTNFILTALVSLPGDLITLYAFNKFGRKLSLQIAYVSCAVFLIAHSYTPTYLNWLKLLLFLCGKVLVVISITGVYIFTSESFPTSARGTLFGICSTAARFGTLLAPFTPLLTVYLEALPTLLFIASALITAFLLLFTTETKNQPTFDTIKHIETYLSNVVTHL